MHNVYSFGESFVIISGGINLEMWLTKSWRNFRQFSNAHQSISALRRFFVVGATQTV